MRLIVDGRRAQAQSFALKTDPRDPATAEDLAARHAFLTGANADLDRVDTMLNAIDRRSKRASPTQRATLHAFRHRLTLDPRNIEDLGTVQLRERLLDLIGRVGSTSFQTPTATQSAEAVSLHAQTQFLAARYTDLK